MAEQGLAIKIGGDASGALSALGKVSSALGKTQGEAKQTSSAFMSVGKTIQVWGDALKHVAAVGKRAFDTLIGDAIDVADKIGEVSKQTGIATDSLQRLKFAAEQNDTSFESLTQGLKFLQRNMGEAAQGSKEVAAAFQRIGLSVSDLSKMNVEQVMQRLADVMADQSIPHAQKMSLAMDLMGRSASQLIPLLSQGGDGIRQLGDEAERLGAVMSRETIESTKQFNDNIKALKTAVFGISASLLNEMAPALEAVTNALREAAPHIVQFGKSVIESVADAVRDGTDALESLSDVFAERLGPVLRQAAEDNVNYLKAFVPAIDTTWEWRDALLGLADVLASVGPAIKATVIAFVESMKSFGRVVGIVIGAVAGHFKNFIPAVGAFFKAVGQMFVNGFKNLANIAVSGGEGIVEGIKAALRGEGWGWIDSFMRGFSRKWNEGLVEIDGRTTEWQNEIADAFKGLEFSGLTDSIDAAVEAEKRRFNELKSGLDEARETEERITKKMIDDIEERLRARNRERDAIKDAEEALKRMGRAEPPPPGGAGAGPGMTTLARGPGGKPVPEEPIGPSAFVQMVTTELVGARMAGMPSDFARFAPTRFGPSRVEPGGTFGTLGGFGSLVTPGQDIAGIRLTEQRKFTTKAEAEAFKTRQNIERDVGKQRQQIEDQLRGKAKRQALEQLELERRERLKALNEETKKRADAERAERAKDKAAEEAKRKKESDHQNDMQQRDKEHQDEMRKVEEEAKPTEPKAERNYLDEISVLSGRISVQIGELLECLCGVGGGGMVGAEAAIPGYRIDPHTGKAIPFTIERPEPVGSTAPGISASFAGAAAAPGSLTLGGQPNAQGCIPVSVCNWPTAGFGGGAGPMGGMPGAAGGGGGIAALFQPGGALALPGFGMPQVGIGGGMAPGAAAALGFGGKLFKISEGARIAVQAQPPAPAPQVPVRDIAQMEFERLGLTPEKIAAAKTLQVGGKTAYMFDEPALLKTDRPLGAAVTDTGRTAVPDFDLSRYAGGLATPEMAEEIFRRISGQEEAAEDNVSATDGNTDAVQKNTLALQSLEDALKAKEFASADPAKTTTVISLSRTRPRREEQAVSAYDQFASAEFRKAQQGNT